MRGMTRTLDERTGAKQREFAARRRVLAAKMAVLAYRGEHGALPADLNALVPDYLPAVPQDPFTQAPLRFRKPPGGFVVYSIGPDGADNGGTPFSYQSQASGVQQSDIGAGVPAAMYQTVRRSRAPSPAPSTP